MANILSTVLIGGAQAVMLALGLVFAVLWVAGMGWQLACGDPAARRSAREFLQEAHRLWAESPWLVVGLGLLVLFFAALATHALVLPWWER